jgi:hypothetical protein
VIREIFLGAPARADGTSDRCVHHLSRTITNLDADQEQQKIFDQPAGYR